MPHPVGITDTNINYLVDFDESSLYIVSIRYFVEHLFCGSLCGGRKELAADLVAPTSADKRVCMNDTAAAE